MECNIQIATSIGCIKDNESGYADSSVSIFPVLYPECVDFLVFNQQYDSWVEFFRTRYGAIISCDVSNVIDGVNVVLPSVVVSSPSTASIKALTALSRMLINKRIYISRIEAVPLSINAKYQLYHSNVENYSTFMNQFIVTSNFFSGNELKVLPAKTGQAGNMPVGYYDGATNNYISENSMFLYTDSGFWADATTSVALTVPVRDTNSLPVPDLNISFSIVITISKIEPIVKSPNIYLSPDGIITPSNVERCNIINETNGTDKDVLNKIYEV